MNAQLSGKTPGRLSKLDPSERRAHRRLAPSQFSSAAVIRMPKRPPIALVDLSPGGALLDLPFQIRPEGNITLELFTSAEQLIVPWRPLRCYVAELRGNVRYHAAGAFDRLVKLPEALVGAPVHQSGKLILTLEAFLRKNQSAVLDRSVQRFNEMLSWVIAVLRRGDPAHVIAAELKAHLGKLLPYVSIENAGASILRSSYSAVEFHGLKFRSRQILSESDRRFLSASAQLIALVERHAERPAVRPVVPPFGSNEAAPLIVHSLSDWQAITNEADRKPSGASGPAVEFVRQYPTVKEIQAARKAIASRTTSRIWTKPIPTTAKA